MADREVTPQAGQDRLVEHLGDQTEVLVDDDRSAVRDRDAGGFLTPVLEGIEGVIGEPGYVLTRCIDTDDAAGVPSFP